MTVLDGAEKVSFKHERTTARKTFYSTSNCTTKDIYFQKKGRNGWWQYDERTNGEIENEFRENPNKQFEIQIAGLLYSIDLVRKIQVRSDDPNKKRRIKRDLKYVKHTKGVAGLKNFIQSKN